MAVLLLVVVVVFVVLVAQIAKRSFCVHFRCLGAAVNHISLVVVVVAAADKLAAVHKLLSKYACRIRV